MKIYWLALLAGVVALAGCQRGVESKEAVRQAVIDHLSSRPNITVSSMEIDVTAVSFRENEADATVSFRAKGADAGTGMTMNYTLERKGNRWVVKSKAESGAMPHGAMGGSTSGEMPAGHPPVGGKEPSGTGK